MKPVLFEKKEECCNCKACANACPQEAIHFKLDDYGFEYPCIDEGKCIECGRCIKICAFKTDEQKGNFPIEGYAARHKSFDVCRNSTSGGMFTALAEYIIDKGGIVYGCAFDEQMIPRHIGVENVEGLERIRGSKYVQSDMGNTYCSVKKDLEEGKYVLFTGTPCQVAALYSFLGKTDTTNLYTADLICHGVPSIYTFNKYIKYIEQKYSHKVTSFLFRDKRYDWNRPLVSIGLGKRKIRWFWNENVFIEYFLKGDIFRPSCFICKYANNKRIGDFTIGDFWGHQKAKVSLEEKKGISCCIVNTSKAQKCFSELNIDSISINTEIIIKGNSQLRHSSKKGEEWDEVMKEISKNGFNNLANSFDRTHKMIRVKSFVKKIVLPKLHE